MFKVVEKIEKSDHFIIRFQEVSTPKPVALVEMQETRRKEYEKYEINQVYNLIFTSRELL